MSPETWLAVIAAISAPVVTIVGLYFKDRQDSRRWHETAGRSNVRHEQNTQRLDKIELEVNGKMQQLVDKTHIAAYHKGVEDAKAGEA